MPSSYKTAFNLNVILKTFGNGSSEMVTSLSMSLENILFNMQLMKYAGANGVSAYGIIMYVGFLFSGVYLGYSVGIAPVVSYHHGANNQNEVKNIFRKSHQILGIASILMTFLAELLAPLLASLFVSYDLELLQMTTHAIRIYSISYLISWFNIYASSFFTSLNNGFVSALIFF